MGGCSTSIRTCGGKIRPSAPRVWSGFLGLYGIILVQKDKKDEYPGHGVINAQRDEGVDFRFSLGGVKNTLHKRYPIVVVLASALSAPGIFF